MAITHPTAIRNSLAGIVSAAADSGSGPAQLVFMTAGSVEVATLTMSDPAFGSPSTGTITADAIAPDADATGGTIALFKVQNSDGTEAFRGSVTVIGGGGDIEMTSLVIAAGEPVELTAFTYTASL